MELTKINWIAVQSPIGQIIGNRSCWEFHSLTAPFIKPYDHVHEVQHYIGLNFYPKEINGFPCIDNSETHIDAFSFSDDSSERGLQNMHNPNNKSIFSNYGVYVPSSDFAEDSSWTSFKYPIWEYDRGLNSSNIVIYIGIPKIFGSNLILTKCDDSILELSIDLSTEEETDETPEKRYFYGYCLNSCFWEQHSNIQRTLNALELHYSLA